MLAIYAILTLFLSLSRFSFAFRNVILSQKYLNIFTEQRKLRKLHLVESIDALNQLASPVSSNLLSLVNAKLLNPIVSNAFTAATFVPQPFWLLITLFPNWKITKQIMGNWYSVILVALIHLLIVVVSISEPNGTAPIVEFAKVFDPFGQPLLGMMGMDTNPNFVSEEWSHILTWDLFVGQFIWLDGLNRGIFTSHSVLLTNLIGPPGLLLHFLTCIILGKGLPQIVYPATVDDENTSKAMKSSALGNNNNSNSNNRKTEKTAQPKPPRTPAADIFVPAFSTLYSKSVDGENMAPILTGVENFLSYLSDDCVWEDFTQTNPDIGKAAIREKLYKRIVNAPPGSRLNLDRVGDGELSSGFTWYLSEGDNNNNNNNSSSSSSSNNNNNNDDEKIGLRGTMYVELNPLTRKIQYLCEGCEPLYKPGDATVELLKKISTTAANNDAANDSSKASITTVARIPTSAEDMVNYLWIETSNANGQPRRDIDETVEKLFSEKIVYEDFNFPKPFIGKTQLRSFLQDFTSIPNISFTPSKISQGTKSCCFTWMVKIANREPGVKGISYYEVEENSKGGGVEITYVRDIPECVIKPPPLLSLATAWRPGLRRFQPLKRSELVTKADTTTLSVMNGKQK